MPLMSSHCLEDLPGCCDSMFAFADHLRVNALDGLSQCFTEGRCGDLFKSYISMGPGDDGIPDSLIVVVNQGQPSAGTRDVGFTLTSVTFDVRLRESGYPVGSIDGSGKVISMPEPALQHQASRQLLAHGEAIHRRLTSMKSMHGLAPEGYQCASGNVGQMLPISPQGGVAGWTILVSINMPWG